MHTMCAIASQISARDVLDIFRGDAPYLFLGAAFVAVGLVSAAFAAIRRKRDSLLIYFALFAVFYGVRMWLQSGMLNLSGGNSAGFIRISIGINYLILVPAFLFFDALGVSQRVIAYMVGGAGTTLALLTFIFGPWPAFRYINNVMVIGALLVLVFRFVQAGATEQDRAAKADLAAITPGLMVFCAMALWDNFAGALSRPWPRIEPYGFAVFLGALGYVAARRTLRRDQQLHEIQKELEVARRIQLSILPSEFPASAQFKVAARYIPMTSVAGDFYDYIVADDRQAGLLIADVSGHGVPAALIASMVKLAGASQRAVAADPSVFLAGMNSVLLGHTQNQFVTAAYVHLDSESRELRYSAAGHPPMLLLRNGETFEVEENGLMLAAFSFAAYTNALRELKAGDRLLLYTDGIVEAANPAGDFLGTAALRELLGKTSDLAPSEAADAIIAAVRQWSPKQDDDWTVIVCDYAGDTHSGDSRNPKP